MESVAEKPAASLHKLTAIGTPLPRINDKVVLASSRDTGDDEGWREEELRWLRRRSSRRQDWDRREGRCGSCDCCCGDCDRRQNFRGRRSGLRVCRSGGRACGSEEDELVL